MFPLVVFFPIRLSLGLAPSLAALKTSLCFACERGTSAGGDNRHATTNRLGKIRPDAPYFVAGDWRLGGDITADNVRNVWAGAVRQIRCRDRRATSPPFHAAATAGASGDAAKVYDPAHFQEILQRDYLSVEHGTLSWQYPPTYILLMLPLAALPYFLGFTLWSHGNGSGIFFLAARSITRDRLILFCDHRRTSRLFQPTSPARNGFSDGDAFAHCGGHSLKAGRFLAGIAAGLLTIKPHLGLLIPIAYLAAGCWRAMAAAALTAVVFAALSVLAFGAEPWAAFIGAVGDTSQRLEAQILPLAKNDNTLERNDVLRAHLRSSHMAFTPQASSSAYFLSGVYGE